MIYKGLNRIGMIGDIKTKGGGEIAEVYGGIGESDPIYYKQREMVGTSPMQFKALGLPLKDYRISGNTLQDGTPSPDMPVDVVGCGVRTENLWDPSSTELARIFEIEPSTAYTAAKYPPLGRSFGRVALSIYDSDMNLQSSDYAYIWEATTLTGNANTRYARVTLSEIPASVTNPWKYIYFGKGSSRSGEAPLPFIPYGYKLPETITNGTDTVTTPIYIGSEPIHRLGNYADYSHYSINKIVRRINKMVLTGQETGIVTGSSKTFFMPVTPAARRTRFMITVLSNKYKAIGNTWDFGVYNASDNIICFVANSPDPGPTPSYSLAINDSRFGGSVSSFRSYLAEQYAAGTPVTIWYVLYEPIEEDLPVPLPELPTLIGTNTLTIDTPVKPSEIDLTGRIKTSGYGQLLDKNLTAINDSTGTPIFIRG